MNTSTNCRQRHLPPRQSNPHPPSLPPLGLLPLSRHPQFIPHIPHTRCLGTRFHLTHLLLYPLSALSRCRTLLKRYLCCRRARPLHLTLPNFHCGTLGKMFSSRISPCSVANFGSLLMPSINFGQMLGSHGLLSLARPRTSRRTYGLFPSLKEEVVSSSRHSLSSYVRPSLRRRNPGHSTLMCQDVASSMQSYVLCITVTVSTLPSRHSGSPYRRDVLRGASLLHVGVVLHVHRHE